MQESLNDGDVLLERHLMSVSTMVSMYRAVPAHGAQCIVLTSAALVHTGMSVMGEVCPTSGAVTIAWVIRGSEFAYL